MSTIEHAGLSDQGPVRENNEDYIAHQRPEDAETRLEKGSLFVLADGVGGNLAGEVASREASETLISAYYSGSKRPGRAMQDAFTQANLRVFDLSHEKPEYSRMQTTLCAFALIGNQVHIGHIGDSRLYRVRGAEVAQLTKDHSEVGELVRMQLLTPEEARHHPRRNVITRAIGSELIPQPDFRVETVEIGDALVLCTDGLWEPVEESALAGMVDSHSAVDACQALIALAIKNGTQDNVSVQVVKVLGWEENAHLDTGTQSSFMQKLKGFLGVKGP